MAILAIDAGTKGVTVQVVSGERLTLSPLMSKSSQARCSSEAELYLEVIG